MDLRSSAAMPQNRSQVQQRVNASLDQQVPAGMCGILRSDSERWHGAADRPRHASAGQLPRVAENAGFGYQLTTIGRDAHAWIAEKVANHQCKIATNATFVEVSWQITAVRQYPYAKAHPLIVEKEKPAAERGTYLHPELYNQPQQMRTTSPNLPKRLQRLNAQR